jgi:hypothetical protein
MRPAVSGKNLIRLRKKTSDKLRRLLAKLRSEEVPANLLSRAPKLQKSVNRKIATNVYINPDLSFAAAQLAIEARKRR